MIPPALNSKEWASRETLRGFNGSVVRIGMGAVVVGDVPRRTGVLFASMRHGIAEYPLPVIEGDALPALIALANAALPDGDPRKVTWKTVDLLRAAIGRVHDQVRGDDFDSKLSRVGLVELSTLADALASLLPPRETAEPRLDKCGCPMVEIMRGEWKTMHVITCTLLPREVKP